MTVRPVNRPPSIAAVAARPLPDGRAELTSRTADPDGDAVSHWWSVKKAPAGASPQLARPGAASTAVAGLTQPGQYVFTLTVVDRAAATRRDVSLDLPARPSIRGATGR